MALNFSACAPCGDGPAPDPPASVLASQLGGPTLGKPGDRELWGSLVTPPIVHGPALMEARKPPGVTGGMKQAGGAGCPVEGRALGPEAWKGSSAGGGCPGDSAAGDGGEHKACRGGRGPGWKANMQRVGVCSLGVKLEPWEPEEPGGLGSL